MTKALSDEAIAVIQQKMDLARNVVSTMKGLLKPQKYHDSGIAAGNPRFTIAGIADGIEFSLIIEFPMAAKARYHDWSVTGRLEKGHANGSEFRWGVSGQFYEHQKRYSEAYGGYHWDWYEVDPKEKLDLMQRQLIFEVSEALQADSSVAERDERRRALLAA